MAFINFDTGPRLDRSTYDVVIIGAGAAGLYLGHLLCGSFRVLIIESGHFVEDESRQALNAVELSGRPMQAASWGRKRAIGGSTIAWGGQSLPFSELDFAERPWLNVPKWPLRRSELDPYYIGANSAMRIDALNYRDECFDLIGRKPADFDSSLVDVHISKWAPEPRFATLFRTSVKKRLDLVYNCQCLFLSGNATQVDGVVVSSFSGHQAVVKAGCVIVAGGAIESTRLLMLSDIESGILSEHHKNWLGKGFMDHPCMDVASIECDDSYDLQRQFGVQRVNGRKYSVRMSASPVFQERHETLNISASLMALTHRRGIDPYRDWARPGKLIRNPGAMMQIANAAVKSGSAFVRDKFMYKYNAELILSVMCEQEFSDQSFMSLSEDKVDEFGLPELRIHWDITERTWHTVVKFAYALKDEFTRLNIGKVVLHSSIEANAEHGSNLMTDVNHHMGGTLMATEAEFGVVDTNLRVHGLKNLYVCSTSVYPTSSHSNPTLTLLALAGRLSDHLTDISRK